MGESEALDHARRLWDEAAATFDNEPDHGLRDPVTYAAWRDLLAQWLPQAPKRILDIGCGTGSLSVIIAGFGHEVTGIDLSPEMVTLASAKAIAAGQQVTFEGMNAAYPRFARQSFDAIVCRHLLWTVDAAGAAPSAGTVGRSAGSWRAHYSD